jgi:hypothetical protein
MIDPNQTIVSLRNRLEMDSVDPEKCGAAGEKAAMWLFERREVIWIYLDQHKDHWSSKLIEEGGKRPDFLLSLDGAALFIDVKTYTPVPQVDGTKRFRLTGDEHSRLQHVQELTHTPVAILFWDKSAVGRFNFAVELVAGFSKTEKIGLDDWRYKDFAADEFANA